MQAEQYHAAEEAVTISGDRIVSLTLKPAFATLTVETVPVGLPIFFNGKKRGVGGLDDQVDPGQYEVTVETPCYALAGERVVLNEGDSRSLTISPPVRKAGVEISVTDDDGNAVRATVYADGVNVGSAPGQVVVPLCTKELKIETGDGLAWTGPAKLREGEYVALPVVLKPSIFSDTNSIGMTFIAIPAGTFAVGCTIGQVSCRNDEKPAHNVKLTRSFSIMTTEVTQGQYRVITDESPSHFSQCGDDCPVEKVSWVDAVKFANALSKSEGLSACYDINGNNVKRVLSHLGCEGYRLPTEAEWEVAARGGTDTLYAGGSDLESVGWYDDNTTHPVGQKYSNSYGLYDMSGNVREWTWDTYDKDYYRSGTMIDPLGPASSLSRVYRGGSWNDRAPFSRVSFRYGFDPGYRSNFLGFRLIRTTPSSTAAANAD
jgi:formylglycine-generating enzyme required for sulfatase activity